MRAYCFPGQGAQDIELINTLAATQEYKNYQNIILNSTGFNLEALINASEEEKLNALETNEVTSLLTVLYSIIKLEELKAKDLFNPDYLTGYSVGQYTALYAAGSYDLETLFRLVWKRCLIMNEANKKCETKMAAIIGLDQQTVESLCEKHNVQISNYNARGQYSIAGEPSNIENAITESLEIGANKSIVIKTAGAWHSKFMKPAEKPFEDILENVDIAPLSIPVIDNATGELLPTNITSIKQQLVKHLSQAVQWESGIRMLIKNNADNFIEVGYGNILSKFGFFISRDAKFLTSDQFVKELACAE